MLSAALSAAGEAVGLYKELSGAKSKSGFSFSDLAVGRAPALVRWRRLQPLLHAGLKPMFHESVGETDVMPLARDLPKYMK